MGMTRAGRYGPRSGWLFWLPLLLFVGCMALFVSGLYRGLYRDLYRDDAPPTPSLMVGRAVPAFRLPAAASNRPPLSSTDFAEGKPKLLTIFASWCVPCAAEAPQLAMLARAGIPVEGIAIRDAREDVDAFLARWGNPYGHIGLDARSAVQMALGSSGVPESFLVDGTGHILYHHIGIVSAGDVPGLIVRWKAAR